MKEKTYQNLLEEVESVTNGESDLIANMANVTALIQESFHFWWTGFYRVQGDELILGPFQGPLACTRIRKGRGVCGTSWAEDNTIVVPNVHEFPGHIACSSASQSEIVVPLRKNGEVIGVLDIDSENLSTFDETDALWLERICETLANTI